MESENKLIIALMIAVFWEQSIQPSLSLRFDESMPTGMGETSNKPPASAGSS
jgi:hypothetical protein